MATDRWHECVISHWIFSPSLLYLSAAAGSMQWNGMSHFTFCIRWPYYTDLIMINRKYFEKKKKKVKTQKQKRHRRQTVQRYISKLYYFYDDREFLEVFFLFCFCFRFAIRFFFFCRQLGDTESERNRNPMHTQIVW